MSLATFTCSVDVSSDFVGCAPASPASSAGGPQLVVTIAAPYVKMASSNVQNDGVRVSYDVTVQNLLSQKMGTPDGTTRTGLQVFFQSGPTNGVAVDNADGKAKFTARNQPYFQYNQILDVMEVSAPRNWVFKLNGATTFSFTVVVSTDVPNKKKIELYYRTAGLDRRGDPRHPEDQGG